jgi:hypothetical protein
MATGIFVVRNVIPKQTAFTVQYLGTDVALGTDLVNPGRQNSDAASLIDAYLCVVSWHVRCIDSQLPLGTDCIRPLILKN